ncbi:MAG: hypothetical protein HC814_03740 [Rhodobacteraceae bacterium]|nr:hypothetical protein [Paracoccaceae bacterium]
MNHHGSMDAEVNCRKGCSSGAIIARLDDRGSTLRWRLRRTNWVCLKNRACTANTNNPTTVQSASASDGADCRMNSRSSVRVSPVSMAASPPKDSQLNQIIDRAMNSQRAETKKPPVPMSSSM